jgi:hypothetical protein
VQWNLDTTQCSVVLSLVPECTKDNVRSAQHGRQKNGSHFPGKCPPSTAETCEYGTLHSKGELRLQMELSVPVSLP